MPLEIQVVSTLDELAGLEPEWRDLWERDPCATPFQSPDWLLPWTKWLWGGGKLRVLAARRQGQVIGLAPFFLWGFDASPPVIRLSLLGSGISDYLGTLSEPAVAPEFAGKLMEYLAEPHGEWQVCDLQELRSCSPLLRAELPAGLARSCSRFSVCPVVFLPGSMEELRSKLPSKFRRNLDHAAAGLRRQGQAEFVQSAPETRGELMQSLFNLHEARWRESHGHGMFHTERVRGFHLDVSGRFERAGLLRLFGLRCNGETIAVQYNVAARGRLYYYLSGFDPAWGKFSPGALLLEHTIRSAIEEGAREFDFLRKPEAYKYLWGARDRVNRQLLIWRQAFAERVA